MIPDLRADVRDANIRAQKLMDPIVVAPGSSVTRCGEDMRGRPTLRSFNRDAHSRKRTLPITWGVIIVPYGHIRVDCYFPLRNSEGR